MHATQLFLTRQVYPMLMSSVYPMLMPGAHSTEKVPFLNRLYIFFLKGVVFVFWHDIIVYIKLLYCVTNFELVWT